MASGEKLQIIQNQINQDFPYIQKMKYVGVKYDLIITSIFISNLTTSCMNPTSFDSGDFCEQKEVQFLRDNKHVTPDGWYHILKLQLLYLFRDYLKAENIGYKSERILSFSYGLIQIQEHYFYFTLTLLKIYENTSLLFERFKLRRKIKKNIAKLKVWGTACEENYQHKYLLVLGEYYRSIKKDNISAKRCFEEGIELAKRYNFNQVIALGYELMWTIDLKYNKYLKEAYYHYMVWGAQTKATHLKTNYHQYFEGAQ